MTDKSCRTNPTSRLYHLKPLGIGTAYVESLTGYIKRLAEVHSVSVGTLLKKEIIPDIQKSYLSVHHGIFTGKEAKYLNSFGKLSNDIIEVLTEKTLVNGLQYLTFYPWTDVLNTRYLFREFQAWCPICYGKNLESKRPIYEHLLWNFRDIQICGKHNVKLVDKCPYCHSSIKTLSYSSRVGYCDKCQSWLGLKESAVSLISLNDMEWYDWVYANIGKLLALSPNLECTNRQNFIENLNNIISANNISMRNFEKEIGVSHRTVKTWLMGEKFLLKDILRLSFKIDQSVINIFTNEIIPPDGRLNNNKILPIREKNKRKFEIDKVRNVINDAMNSEKAMSLSTISKLAGVSLISIYRHFPNEVIKLKIRYNQFLKQSRINKLNLIKSTMESLYERGIYPSMKALKREFGKRVIINNKEREVWITTLNELGCTSDYKITDSNH